MARKTKLQSLQSRIAALQAEADKLRKAEEKGEVIDKIKHAIEHYGITSAELYDGKPAKTVKIGKPAKKTRKGAGTVKYRDEAGNTWTGFGPKPRWFTEALAGGKTVEDLKA